MQPTHATLLFLDWDSTLTTASTLPLIASASTYPDAQPAWEGLGRAYGDDMARYEADKGESGKKVGWEEERRYLVNDPIISSTVPFLVCDRV